MKKKILSLALAVVLTLALVPVAFAAPREDRVAEVGGIPDTTFTRSIVTPHDYLGTVRIGGLYLNGSELTTWNFGVYIVDDDAYFFDTQGYLSKKLTNYIFANYDAANGGLYLENGKSMCYLVGENIREIALQQSRIPLDMLFERTRGCHKSVHFLCTTTIMNI